MSVIVNVNEALCSKFLYAILDEKNTCVAKKVVIFMATDIMSLCVHCLGGRVILYADNNAITELLLFAFRC